MLSLLLFFWPSHFCRVLSDSVKLIYLGYYNGHFTHGCEVDSSGVCQKAVPWYSPFVAVLWCLSESCAVVQSVCSCPLVSVKKLCHGSVRLSLSSPRGGRSSITRGICGGKEKLSARGFYLKYFGFPLSLSFDQSATLIHLPVTENADISKP